MKAEITLDLDVALLRKVRALAAEECTSISVLLTGCLERLVREHKTYDRARKRALARLREGLDLHWSPARSRDELHVELFRTAKGSTFCELVEGAAAMSHAKASSLCAATR